MAETSSDANFENNVTVLHEVENSEISAQAHNQILSETEFSPSSSSSKVYDLADVVTGRKNVSTLMDEEKYHYFKHHYQPTSESCMFQKVVSKGKKTWTLRYQLSWLCERSWHVYSKELEGGSCKVCVLFDDCMGVRGNFMKNAFQNISKSEKIALHEQTEYHQKAMERATLFLNSYENPEQRVDHDKQNDTNYDRNIHILKRIIEAVLLCAQQGIALHGHRDHTNYVSNEDDDNDDSISRNRGNFLAILEAFVKMLNHMLKEMQKCPHGKFKMK